MAPETHKACAPQASSISPNTTGASACATRDGASSIPARRPKPAEPNKASGSVPLTIVIKPILAPCRAVNSTATGAPKISSSAAPTGCNATAMRPETSGCKRLRNPASASRAVTCAMPSSEAAATAAAGEQPAACSTRGKCAAMAAKMNPLHVNVAARIHKLEAGGAEMTSSL